MVALLELPNFNLPLAMQTHALKETFLSQKLEGKLRFKLFLGSFVGISLLELSKFSVVFCSTLFKELIFHRFVNLSFLSHIICHNMSAGRILL